MSSTSPETTSNIQAQVYMSDDSELSDLEVSKASDEAKNTDVKKEQLEKVVGGVKEDDDDNKNNKITDEDEEEENEEEETDSKKGKVQEFQGNGLHPPKRSSTRQRRKSSRLREDGVAMHDEQEVMESASKKQGIVGKVASYRYHSKTLDQVGNDSRFAPTIRAPKRDGTTATTNQLYGGSSQIQGMLGLSSMSNPTSILGNPNFYYPPHSSGNLPPQRTSYPPYPIPATLLPSNALPAPYGLMPQSDSGSDSRTSSSIGQRFPTHPRAWEGVMFMKHAIENGIKEIRFSYSDFLFQIPSENTTALKSHIVELQTYAGKSDIRFEFFRGALMMILAFSERYFRLPGWKTLFDQQLVPDPESIQPSVKIRIPQQASIPTTVSAPSSSSSSSSSIAEEKKDKSKQITAVDQSLTTKSKKESESNPPLDIEDDPNFDEEEITKQGMQNMRDLITSGALEIELSNGKCGLSKFTIPLTLSEMRNVKTKAYNLKSPKLASRVEATRTNQLLLRGSLQVLYWYSAKVHGIRGSGVDPVDIIPEPLPIHILVARSQVTGKTVQEYLELAAAQKKVVDDQDNKKEATGIGKQVPDILAAAIAQNPVSVLATIAKAPVSSSLVSAITQAPAELIASAIAQAPINPDAIVASIVAKEKVETDSSS